MSHAWPVAITAAGPVAAGTTLWRHGDDLRVTAIVAATFAFAPGTMPLAEPRPLAWGEQHHDGSPMRSIRASGDLAPHLELADVIFVGHAHTGGAPAPSCHVRLVVAQGTSIALDKRLEVIGNRHAVPGQPPPAPEPFVRMPIVYERAFGGIGWADNPLGVGVQLQRGAPEAMPNFIHPDAARADGPAGYGPISWSWPARKQLLGGHPRKLLDDWIADISAEIDPEFFQAAPRDQRIPHLRGDEAILLEGLHPAHRALRMRLPRARAAAWLTTPGEPDAAIPLVADTLYIDGDAERCTVIWRGSAALADEDAIAETSILVGVETESARIAWPSTRTQSRASIPPPREERMPSGEQALSGTMVMEEGRVISSAADEEEEKENPLAGTRVLTLRQAETAGQAAAIPFSSAPLPAPRTPARPIPGAPWSPGVPAIAPPAVHEDDDEEMETALIPMGDLRAYAKAHAPSTVQAAQPVAIAAQPVAIAAQPAAIAAQPAAQPEPKAEPFEGTFVLSLADLEKARAVQTPFPLAPSSTVEAAPSQPIPGAPWAQTPAPIIPRQAPSLASTMDLQPPDEVLQPADLEDDTPAPPPLVADPEPAPAPPPLPLPLPLPPAPAPPPPVPVSAPDPAPPSIQAEPAKPAWSWAEPTPSRPELPKPPEPKAPPKKTVTTALYGKFVRKDK